MKEQVLAKYGKGPAVFRVRDADEQRVGDNHVRVRVGAFALNPVDLKIQSGQSEMILPFAPPSFLASIWPERSMPSART